MSDEQDKIEVVNNEANHQFEAKVSGQVAFAAYKLQGETITFTHTVVPPELEGQGLGSKIVKTGLEYARAEHLTVVPQCPFVASYIQRHPEYNDLIATGGSNGR